MKKSFIIVFILFFLISNYIFGDENPDIYLNDEENTNIPEAERNLSNIRNNWISGELSLIGIGLRYERMLNSYFSVGLNVYANDFLYIINLGGNGSIRLYPIKDKFFFGFGLGFQITANTGMDGGQSGGAGFGIAPEIGWKIDVGKPGGFFIQPGIKMPFTFWHGTPNYYYSEPALKPDPEHRVFFGFFVFYLGMGIAF